MLTIYSLPVISRIQTLVGCNIIWWSDVLSIINPDAHSSTQDTSWQGFSPDPSSWVGSGVYSPPIPEWLRVVPW